MSFFKTLIYGMGIQTTHTGALNRHSFLALEISTTRNLSRRKSSTSIELAVARPLSMPTESLVWGMGVGTLPCCFTLFLDQSTSESVSLSGETFWVDTWKIFLRVRMLPSGESECFHTCSLHWESGISSSRNRMSVHSQG